MWQDLCLPVWRHLPLRTLSFLVWAPFQYKDRLSGYGIPILKIRRSRDRLIFNMGIPIQVSWHLYIDTAPWVRLQNVIIVNSVWSSDTIWRHWLGTHVIHLSKNSDHDGYHLVILKLPFGQPDIGNFVVPCNFLLPRATYMFKSISIHYSDVIMMASQITTPSMICWTGCSGADQRKHQSSASLALVRGIHRWWENYQHKGPVTRKIFPFDDVIMKNTA